MRKTKEIPQSDMKDRPIQAGDLTVKEIPDAEMVKKELPNVGIPENTVVIGGQIVEIKPTKVRYQRNRTAVFYKFLEAYPLAEILAMDAGAFGDDRDGDKAVMDWLIAATDNDQLIIDNYNDMDTSIIEKMVSIFKRVNLITEKEEKLKNLESRGKVVSQ